MGTLFLLRASLISGTQGRQIPAKKRETNLLAALQVKHPGWAGCFTASHLILPSGLQGLSPWKDVGI